MSGHIKSQHVALKEVYPEMTRKERREFIRENIPHMPNKQEKANESS